MNHHCQKLFVDFPSFPVLLKKFKQHSLSYLCTSKPSTMWHVAPLPTPRHQVLFTLVYPHFFFGSKSPLHSSIPNRLRPIATAPTHIFSHLFYFFVLLAFLSLCNSLIFPVFFFFVLSLFTAVSLPVSSPLVFFFLFFSVSHCLFPQSLVSFHKRFAYYSHYSPFYPICLPSSQSDTTLANSFYPTFPPD